MHVYEKCMLGYKRISAFDHPVEPEHKPVVRVLYCGGVHYGEFCFGFALLIELLSHAWWLFLHSFFELQK